jgi:hypothetical protein
MLLHPAGYRAEIDVIADTAFQRELELRNIASQLAERKIGQSLRTLLAPEDGPQHRLPTLAHGVGHGAGKLDCWSSPAAAECGC